MCVPGGSFVCYELKPNFPYILITTRTGSIKKTIINQLLDDNVTNEFETFFDISCTFLFFKKTSFTIAALTRTIPIQTGKTPV